MGLCASHDNIDAGIAIEQTAEETQRSASSPDANAGRHHTVKVSIVEPSRESQPELPRFEPSDSQASVNIKRDRSLAAESCSSSMELGGFVRAGPQSAHSSYHSFGASAQSVGSVTVQAHRRAQPVHKPNPFTPV